MEVDKYYKKKAKHEIDFLFDKHFLNEDLTRESIDWLEDYWGYILQSTAETSAKCAVLTANLRDRKNKDE